MTPSIYLHPTDGFTFLENVPEKPKLCPIPKQDNCKEFEDERGCECTYLVKTYEHALAEAIEKRIPVLNPGVVFTTFKRFQEGELYPWPGTWEKTQIEITCPDGIEGCEVYHTKTVVILSAPKEEKQKVMIIDDLPNVKELVNSDMSYTEGSEPVNSSMSEKEEPNMTEQLAHFAIEEKKQDIINKMSNLAHACCHWKDGELTGYNIERFEREAKKILMPVIEPVVSQDQLTGKQVYEEWTLQEKPDWITIASENESILHQDQFTGFIMGCNYVWSSHVEPLQKDIKTMQEKEKDLRLIIKHHVSEITRLKEDNDLARTSFDQVMTLLHQVHKSGYHPTGKLKDMIEEICTD